jgi:hypothetical protein
MPRASDPAPVEEAPPEPAASVEKRPMRLYQTEDGVSVLTNRHDGAEPAPALDAGSGALPPKPPPEPVPSVEPEEIAAPAPSARPLPPADSAAPSKAVLLVLVGAVAIVASAIIGIFFRKR